MTPIRADLHRFMPAQSGRARPTAVAAAVATALGVLVAPAAFSQTASQADVQSLKQQVQKLQNEIDKLQQNQTVPTPSALYAGISSTRKSSRCCLIAPPIPGKSFVK